MNLQSDKHPQNVWPSIQTYVFSSAQKNSSRLLEISTSYMKLKSYQELFFTKKTKLEALFYLSSKFFYETRVIKIPLFYHKNRQIDQWTRTNKSIMNNPWVHIKLTFNMSKGTSLRKENELGGSDTHLLFQHLRCKGRCICVRTYYWKQYGGSSKHWKVCCEKLSEN